MIVSTRRTAILGFAVAAILLSATPASSSPSVASKQAEAQRVLAQIQGLDANLEQAVEAYNAAQVRLAPCTVSRCTRVRCSLAAPLRIGVQVRGPGGVP